MGTYHFIAGSLMEPEDDFIQRLRKNTTALFFIPSSVAAFVFVIASFFALDGSQYQTTRLLQNAAQTICAWITYGWMRKTRHVGDIQAAILCWVTLLSFTPRFLNVPDSDTALWAILLALLSVFLRIPQLLPFLATCLIYALVAQWNVAYATKQPDMLLVLPGYSTDKTAFIIFTENLVPTIFTAFTVLTFVAVIDESERRGKAQKAANQMTLEILQLQRRYNTTKIADVIEECKTAGVVDAELLTLFANMNSNLESYRPFLPNYLFNDTDSEDEKEKGDNQRPGTKWDNDDEGSIPAHDAGSSSRTHPTMISEGSRTGGSSSVLGARQTSTIGLIKRGNLYNGRVTFALVDVNAERLAPSDFGGKTSDVLKSVVHMIYTLAKETKASVHSMLGDTVQLTWNATSNVVLPETKGAVFLARLAERFQMPEPLLPSASRRTTTTTQVEEHEEVRSALPVGHPPVLSLRAAVCSGRASVHSLTANNQQALLIEAAWLPTLEACFDLAKRVGRAAGAEPSDSSSSIVLMDDRTAKACHLEVEAAAVEVVQSSETQRAMFLGHYAANLEIKCSSAPSAIPPALAAPQCNSFCASNLTTTFVHQLLREYQRADDEWMYQIQPGADDTDEHNVNSARVNLKALMLVAEGRLSDALKELDDEATLSVAANSSDYTTCPVFLEALRATCISKEIYV